MGEISVWSKYQKGSIFLTCLFALFCFWHHPLETVTCATVWVFSLKMPASKLRSEFEAHFPFFLYQIYVWCHFAVCPVLFSHLSVSYVSDS